MKDLLFVFYPDSTFILQGKGSNKDLKRLFFVEIDRATERPQVIREKLIAYRLFYSKNKSYFEEFGGTMKVLFQCITDKRKIEIVKILQDMEFKSSVWVTSESQVTPESVFSAPIWMDSEGKEQGVLR